MYYRRVPGCSVEPDLSRLLDAVSLAAFDFDGVIADTEPLHAASYQRLLAELGVKFDPTDFAAYIGKQDREIYRLLGRNYGVSLDIDTVGQRRRDLFVEAAIETGLQPYPYVTPLLDSLQARSCPAIILSAQAFAVVERLLRHWRLFDRFSQIITADAVDPEAMSKDDLVSTLSTRLRIPPGKIVLFDDAAHALSHAKSLGLRTVGVLHALGGETEMDAEYLIRHPERC
jgi:beta-phosphoglucomutase